MDTGYYKFYRSKFKVLLSFLPVVFLLVIAVIDPSMWIMGIFSLIFFVFLFFKVVIPMLMHRPFIEMTPSYIKVDGWDRLLWIDVERVEKTIKNERGRTLVIYNFWIKDVSKYQLTATQKMNEKMKFSPFALMLPGPLKNEDCVKLIEVLKAYVPNNNLD